MGDQYKFDKHNRQNDQNMTNDTNDPNDLKKPHNSLDIQSSESQFDQREKLFYDGERYYTYDEFFGDDDDGELKHEEDELNQPRKGLRVIVATVLAVALLTNILAFWPQVYNLAAIQFLVKSRELSKNEHIQQYKQSVVVVSTGSGNGTGFVISDDGLIITNHHVIAERDRLLVSFQEGGGKPAELVMDIPEIDIALLEVEPEQLIGTPLELQTKWQPNEPVYVIGNPLFFSFIANEGYIVGQATLSDWDVPVIVLDAPIYKGNSGSPVINEEGQVIGVVFATTKMTIDGKKKKVGLAVPIDAVLTHAQLADE